MLKLIKNFQYTPASLVLIAMNLVPLIGVVLFGWDAGTIIFLYWLENVLIGILNIPKLLSCRGYVPRSGEEIKIRQELSEATGVFAQSQAADGGRVPIGALLFLAVFFSVHYGIFCFGHYMFIQSLFEGMPKFSELPTALAGGFLLWSLLGLALSHSVSMIINFYGKKEYLTRSANVQMFLPYTRIIVLHMVIIFGGFLALVFNEGLGILIMLVIIKTVVDLFAHQVEHSDIKSLINPGVTDQG